MDDKDQIMKKREFEYKIPAGLPDLGKMNQAPEAYFEQLSHRVMERITKRRPAPVSITLIRIAAVAAIVTGIWAGIYTLTDIRTDVPSLSFNEIELSFGNVLFADITDFSGILDANEKTYNDLENALISKDDDLFYDQKASSLPKQDIFDYLFENIENQ